MSISIQRRPVIAAVATHPQSAVSGAGVNGIVVFIIRAEPNLMHLSGAGMIGRTTPAIPDIGRTTERADAGPVGSGAGSVGMRIEILGVLLDSAGIDAVSVLPR